MSLHYLNALWLFRLGKKVPTWPQATSPFAVAKKELNGKLLPYQ
jgi:hypothetical protein